MGKIRVRQAPSPTGKLHIGNVHTFLFNYCFARHSGGEVLLRIEDTDPVRSKSEYVSDIKDSLTWLGLTWDGEPQFQSKRQANYLEYAKSLIKSGDAYYCYHTPEELEEERKTQESEGKAPRYSGGCRNLTKSQIDNYVSQGRKPTIRFRMTGEKRPKEIVYQDLVYGEISYDPQDIGDFVIVRSDGSYLYNFGNVIDDHDMGITHVIRGQGHLTNTPRQILIYLALGWDVPEFGHLPDVLNPDRAGKLSKRYGAASVTEFRSLGYLPEAIINFLGNLGWSHPEGKEFFTLAEMVKEFSFDRVGKAPPAFDVEKLDYFNTHYLRLRPLQDLIGEALEIKDKKTLSVIEPMVKERITKISDIKHLAGYLTEAPARPKFKYEQYNKVLSIAAQSAEKIDPWTKENIEPGLREAQAGSGIGAREFFVTVGQAISGSDVFLPLFDSLEILGQPETLRRLRRS